MSIFAAIMLRQMETDLPKGSDFELRMEGRIDGVKSAETFRATLSESCIWAYCGRPASAVTEQPEAATAAAAASSESAEAVGEAFSTAAALFTAASVSGTPMQTRGRTWSNQICVCVRARACVRVRVCVCEREREREGGREGGREGMHPGWASPCVNIRPNHSMASPPGWAARVPPPRGQGGSDRGHQPLSARATSLARARARAAKPAGVCRARAADRGQKGPSRRSGPGEWPPPVARGA